MSHTNTNPMLTSSTSPSSPPPPIDLANLSSILSRLTQQLSDMTNTLSALTHITQSMAQQSVQSSSPSSLSTYPSTSTSPKNIQQNNNYIIPAVNANNIHPSNSQFPPYTLPPSSSSLSSSLSSPSFPAPRIHENPLPPSQSSSLSIPNISVSSSSPSPLMEPPTPLVENSISGRLVSLHPDDDDDNNDDRDNSLVDSTHRLHQQRGESPFHGDDSLPSSPSPNVPSNSTANNPNRSNTNPTTRGSLRVARRAPMGIKFSASSGISLSSIPTQNSDINNTKSSIATSSADEDKDQSSDAKEDRHPPHRRSLSPSSSSTSSRSRLRRFSLSNLDDNDIKLSQISATTQPIGMSYTEIPMGTKRSSAPLPSSSNEREESLKGLDYEEENEFKGDGGRMPSQTMPLAQTSSSYSPPYSASHYHNSTLPSSSSSSITHPFQSSRRTQSFGGGPHSLTLVPPFAQRSNTGGTNTLTSGAQTSPSHHQQHQQASPSSSASTSSFPPSHFPIHSSTDNKIKLNVGGQIYTTTISTLTRDKFHSNMFTAMFSGNFHVDSNKDEKGSIFIDRDPTYFRHILNYLRDGSIYISGMSNGQKNSLLREARYFGVTPLVSLLHADARQMKTNLRRELSSEKEYKLHFIHPEKMEKDLPILFSKMTMTDGYDFESWMSGGKNKGIFILFSKKLSRGELMLLDRLGM